jgi:hypothetical protein
VAQAAAEQQAKGALQLVASAIEAAQHINSMNAIVLVVKRVKQQQQLQSQEQDEQEHRASRQQSSRVVLLLLRQLLKQPSAQQWQQQHASVPLQQQQQPQTQQMTTPAAADTAPVSLESSAADLSKCIKQCVLLLTSLLAGSFAALQLHSQVQCQHMAHTLQLIEAGVRCMAAIQTTPSASASSSSSSSAAGGAAATATGPGAAAGAAPAPAAVAAAAADGSARCPIRDVVLMCAKVLTNLQDSSKQHIRTQAQQACTPRRVRQHQQALQRVLLVCEAALSLLLTVTKVPGLMQSAEACAGFSKCIICLQHLAAAAGGSSAVKLGIPPPPLHQQQQDSQQQQNHHQQQQQQQLQQGQQAGSGCTPPTAPTRLPGALWHNPHHELQRAVLVLTGRYLMLVGSQAEQLAATESTSAASWAAKAMMGVDLSVKNNSAAAGGSEEDSGGVLGAGPLWDVISLTLQYGPA